VATDHLSNDGTTTLGLDGLIDTLEDWQGRDVDVGLDTNGTYFTLAGAVYDFYMQDDSDTGDPCLHIRLTERGDGTLMINCARFQAAVVYRTQGRTHVEEMLEVCTGGAHAYLTSWVELGERARAVPSGDAR
jgi:hypothetical protein